MSRLPSRFRSTVAAAVAASFVACAPGDSGGGADSGQLPSLDGAAIARHMRTLSADSFAGRAPGTPGR